MPQTKPLVGKKSGKTTQHGRDVYTTDDGKNVSELSVTFQIDDKWYNAPSIYNGVKYKEGDVKKMVEEGKVKPSSVHDSLEDALNAAEQRTDTIKYAKGGITMNRQMNLFADGGMMDDSGEQVNGVEVPPGSLREEVADDIPARLSEGEFVIPADVVRYIGLEKLMALRDKAKQGLQRMQEMGQMGNAEEVENPDQTFAAEDNDMFEQDIDSILNEVDSPEVEELALGGFLTGQDFSKAPKNPVIDVAYFKHSDGRMMWITKINGKPISPPPDGFVEIDPEEAKKTGLKEEEKVDKVEEEIEKERVKSSGGGGVETPTPTPSKSKALNIDVDPKTGKATVKTPPELLAIIPGGAFVAAGMKMVSKQQADRWNESLAKGNIINAVPDAKNPDSRNWVDITNVESTGYGINKEGKSFSSPETIKAQDDKVFGGTFDKDGNFIESNSERAAASETTNVRSSTGADTADPGMPTTNDSRGTTSSNESSDGSTGGSDGVGGSREKGNDAFGGAAKGGLISKRAAKTKPTKKGLASKKK